MILPKTANNGYDKKGLTMTDMTKTAIGFVLDESGSMASILDDTIGGFNTFIEKQKSSEGTATLTLVKFNSDVTVVHDMVDLEEVSALDTKTFSPAGLTALNDGIATAITNIGTQLAAMEEDERPGSVIIAIMTDGGENSSDMSRDAVFEMIKHQKEVYNWQFIFLGANQDAISTGSSLGISAGQSVTFSASNMTGAMDSVSSKITSYRSATSRGFDAAGTLNYSDSDRKEVL